MPEKIILLVDVRGKIALLVDVRGKIALLVDVRGKRMRLECVASFELFGNIMSLQSVRLAGSIQDSLLLSFSEAKVHSIELFSCCLCHLVS
jgi:hypothetical protein